MSCLARNYGTPCVSLVPHDGPLTEIAESVSGGVDFVPEEFAHDAKDKRRLVPSHNTKTMATVTECTPSNSHSSSIVSLSSATSTSSTFCDESDGKMADNAIEERNSPWVNNQTVSTEIDGPSSYSSESSPTPCDSEDGFAELSASIATIRPPIRTGTPLESSASSMLGDASEPVSLTTSPHSDQGYTLEIRPPSSIMATRDVDEQDSYDDSPTMSQINSSQSRSSLPPTSTAGLHVLSNSRRPGVVRVAPQHELPPVPPVASIRSRRLRPSSQDGSQLSGSNARPSSLSDRRGSAEYPRANHTSSFYLRSSHYPTVEEDGVDGQVPEVSTSTARSPSLSPLYLNASPVAQRAGSSSSVPPSAAPAPVDYLTGAWPSEISGVPSSNVPSPSNPFLSTPSSSRPVSTPNAREDGRHTFLESERTHSRSVEAESMSFPESFGLSNSPSVPPRTTRFTTQLPPSPGSSLRTSIFNSPFPPAASPADSWGTAATIPGESVYNQTTSIPGEATQWWDMLQPPHLARNPTPTWLPEPNGNGRNPLWTNADWPAWSDSAQVPPVGPMPTTTPSPPYVAPPGYLLICSACGSPAPACVCRRYVRMAPVHTGATSTGLRTPFRPAATPHPTFWFLDGTVTFEVEDAYFKIHKYFFERHSEYFRILLARRLAASVVPVRIPDVRKQDFERLLKVFYPSNLSNPDLATAEEWTSVLTLAVKWHMEELISLAIQELTPITSAVDKISLAMKFGLFGYNLMPNNYNRDWLLPALRELCGRNFPLRFEEARKLDMWTVVKVWEVQHEISNGGLNHNTSIERLIKRRFGLE